MASRSVFSLVAMAGVMALLSGCAGMFTAPLPDYAAIVAASDRSDADRQTDVRRDPVKLLGFIGVTTGQTVLDMGAGGGYSTELMARAVGPSGKVYGQDDKARERFEARAKTPAMANVTYVVRPFDDPVPPEVKTTSSGIAPKTSATVARASSSASCAARPAAWCAEGFAKSPEKYGSIASSTSGRTAVEAALSR